MRLICSARESREVEEKSPALQKRGQGTQSHLRICRPGHPSYARNDGRGSPVPVKSGRWQNQTEGGKEGAIYCAPTRDKEGLGVEGSLMQVIAPHTFRIECLSN